VRAVAGVDEGDLQRFGPVDAVIAAQLAPGAQPRLQTDCGLGVTGVAGPGEQGGRALGEVFIAVAIDAEGSAKKYRFDGSRGLIRITTVVPALSDLVDVLELATATRS
jgi:nicotinamide-nucleotide amidase